ncbi:MULTISPECIES: DUF4279 domain-containing protein [Paraburkholderia]|uniref:DUF4279 domain-containing protein n=1 Tax=Paraburkholderia TaxID=1822464 RepID=UPI001EF97D4C|nr:MULTISPECIES: DUF4279 domain-containing protein [Paraburkholderia]MDH6148518.1 hypothetical protein [Paraburkholderia sp. WSM4179]
MTTSTTMRPDSSSTWPLAHATFYINGDAVSPDFWTDYFGVTPSRSRTKGEPYLYPSGKLSDHPAKRGSWAVESERAVQSNLLEPHLRYLIKTLALPRHGLRDLVCRDGVAMSIWCYWMNETGDRMPDVPDDIRAMMEAMGGTIEIDEYR